MSTYFHSGRLPADRGVVFTLFSNPHYLDPLTPPWFRLQPLGQVPKELTAGATISYRLRWRGFAWRWTSLLTDWQPPDYFAYEQIEGPYRFFRHEHFFLSTGGEIQVCDRLFFRAPGGRLVDRLIATPELRRIFTFREDRARALLPVLQASCGWERRASLMPWTSASSSAIERPT